MKRLARALPLAVLVLCALATPALAAPAVDATFPVKGLETNNKIVAGPDGNMWATVSGVEAGENDVARITPAGGVEEFEISDLQSASGIAVGPEGKLWVTGTNAVASFSPSDPKESAKKTQINTIAGNSPIVAGPDGNMWVATMNLVLRFAPSKPETQTPFAGVGELLPNDVDVAGSLIVVADGGQERGRIVILTTSGEEHDILIDGGSQGVAGGPGGQVAYSQQVPKSGKPEQVGLIAPPNPAQAFEQSGDPFGVALGADQAYWVVRFADGALTRMTTAGERTSLGGLPKESARQIAAGPAGSNTLWVTLVKNEAEAVARVSGLEPPVEKGGTAPQTRITKRPKHTVKTSGKRAKVRFRFASTIKGSSFQCALTKLHKGKKPKPVFKSCKSPKSYSLKPGRYRFKVRAVASGVVDPSPAFGTFVVVHVANHKR
jgi:sugar lactone lactonase YvrE